MGCGDAICRVVPHHGFDVAERNGEGRLRRRVQRRVGLRQAAQRTRTCMRGRRSGLIVEACALLACAVADDGGLERIGNGLAGGPARGNRGQHLHRQGDQDDG